MVKYEEYCLENKPSWTLVVGDVNSTVACSLVAAKLGIKVCHLEAGLRSGDWSMPEEVNRVVTDRLSDLLLTPSRDGDANLLAEGVSPEKIHFVGNIMIDSLYHALPASRESDIHERLAIEPEHYVLMTLHRPSNVDGEESLVRLKSIIEEISDKVPVVLPLHPRTRKNLESFGLLAGLEKLSRCVLTEPAGYIDFLALSSRAKLVMTDSGGLQEETTALGVPCLTLRENTERPITITEGTNRLVGTSKEEILSAAHAILGGNLPDRKCPEYWDGKTAERCVQVLRQFFA
jgi:UDP-N-acetylglucosamine 2-epimerase (non-hydrolysing)